MTSTARQSSLSHEDQGTPAEAFAKESANRALDDLFTNTRLYRRSAAYMEMVNFVGNFRHYSPYNAMLIHLQMPGARYVAPAGRWAHDYGRDIKPAARPLVILQPMGPVMLVFDVSATEPREGSRHLPPEIENPFAVRNGRISGELPTTIVNARRDGVEVEELDLGSQAAGSIRSASGAKSLDFQIRVKPKPEFVPVPRRYHLSLDRNQSKETRFVTLAHELGHLYAGHLGTLNPKWWPDRRELDLRVREFEAESIAYLVCARFGIDNPSEKYLAGYTRNNEEIPEISLDCVTRVAGLIEQMGRGRLAARK
jgi:hypothetical protein